MNHHYKRLMKQHGGYIPFSALSQIKSRNSKRTQKRSQSRRRTIRKSRLPSTTRYAVGTILRKGNNLYKVSKLNQLKRWIKI